MQIPRLLSSVAILASSIAFAANDTHITINGGNVPHHNTPITAVLNLTDTTLADKPFATLNPSGTLVQIEHVKDNNTQLILRWVEPNLQPAQSKEYDLEFTAVHGNLPQFHFT